MCTEEKINICVKFNSFKISLCIEVLVVLVTARSLTFSCDTGSNVCMYVCLYQYVNNRASLIDSVNCLDCT
jgi:hypothetical protein